MGVSASGRTPYVVAAVAYARARGAHTAAVTCNHDTPLAEAADITIIADVGPEVISGSTRMKAGSAQKMIPAEHDAGRRVLLLRRDRGEHDIGCLGCVVALQFPDRRVDLARLELREHLRGQCRPRLEVIAVLPSVRSQLLGGGRDENSRVLRRFVCSAHFETIARRLDLGSVVPPRRRAD